MPPIRPLTMRYLTILLTSLLLTSVVYSQTDEEQVNNMINDSIKANPRNSNWLYLKGMMLVEIKKYQSAIEPLSLSLKYLHQFKIGNPNAMTVPNDKPLDSCDILHIRAFCYDTLDSLENSITDYRYLQSRMPNDFFYSIAVSKLYIKRKQFDNAQAEIENIKKRNGNLERGLVQQAILFYEFKKYQEAFKSIEIALQKYPTSIEGLLTKGKILMKLNRITEACRFFDEAKLKISLEYFGGQRGYQRDFESDIDKLKSINCK